VPKFQNRAARSRATATGRGGAQNPWFGAASGFTLIEQVDSFLFDLENRRMVDMPAPPEAELAWRRIARLAGYLTAGCLLVGTVLFLLDSLNALGASPSFHRTPAGPLHDEAHFWVAVFAHQHHILWDIIARDTLFPLAFIALMVLILAAANVVRGSLPEAQLMAVFFAVGGTIAALADLIYLAGTDFWRLSGWTPDPAARMVAVGRSTEALNSLTRWPEAAGFIVLAAGLVCLGRLCRRQAELPTTLSIAAFGEAVLLVGIALSNVAESDDAYNIFSLLTGALVGPLVAAWLGWHLGRPHDMARSLAAGLAR
jgi:hypothetical protein